MEALVLVPLLIWGMVALLSLLASVFWLWMLVDCAMNEPSDTDKIVWVLIIIFTSLIGALAYYFLRRPQRRSGDVA